MNRTYRAAIVAASVMLLAACQSGRPAQLPAPAVEGRAQSIVFASAEVLELQATQTASRTSGDASGGWYAWRNDVGPMALRGYQGPVYDQQISRTYDRQAAYGGHVQNHYRRYDCLRREVRQVR